MKTVLFACVHNAGRSQIAAAWVNALSYPKAAQTGLSPIPTDDRWKQFGGFAMRFTSESQRWSPKEVGDENKPVYN
jgi:hypothetical protein